MSTTIKRSLHEYQLTKHWQLDWTKKSTRLHSSRMRTARSLTVSPSMLCSGGALSGGCLVLEGCLLPRGAWSQGGAWSRVGASGGCLLWGVPAPGGGVVSQHALRQTPPPVDRILDTRFWTILPCPKLRLRAVNILVVFQQPSATKRSFRTNCTETRISFANKL